MMNRQEKRIKKENRLKHKKDVKNAKNNERRSRSLPSPAKAMGRFYYKLRVAQFNLASLKDKKGQIVFLGDSLTELCNLNKFYKLVKKKNKLKIYNRGISGDTTAGVIERMDNSAINLRPRKLVLLIGVNDVFAKINNERIISNFNKILDILNKELNDTKVYICSLTPVCQTALNKEFIDVDYCDKNIIEINKEYKNIAKKRNIDFIELFDILKDENNNLIKDFTIDGVHFNKQCYKIISSVITSYLNKD